MRKLLLNPTLLFRKLRQLSMLLTLLLALPQTAWGESYTTTGYDVIDATGNNAGTRFTWNTNATGTSTTWRWVIDCEAGTVITPDINTLTFTLPAKANITLSIDGYANDMSTVDSKSLRKLILDGLSNDLTVSAYLRKGSNQYDFIGSNGVFTPNNWTESMSTDGAVNITITNNQLDPVSCTINSITLLTVQRISTNDLVWPEFAEDAGGNYINDITKTSSNGVTTLTGNLSADTGFRFQLKKYEGSNKNPSVLTEQYAIAYSSSNTNVAEVSGGDVTIKGYGSTTITATLTENDYYFYDQSTYSYTLTNTGTYGLTIAGTAVTSANASAITGTGISGTVSFDATNKILTLNGATIEGTIESSLAIFSIHLTGNNSIRGNTTALLNGIKSTNGGTLTFTADANAALTITTTGDAASAITGFANVTMGTGAYLQISTPTKYDTNGKNFCWQVSSANIVKELVITSAPCYPLWIGNTQFTSTSTPTGFSFDATNNILTLTNVTQANPLISGLANLTIALSGDNSITKSDSSAVIRSINSQAALIIQKAGTGDGSLYLENNGSDPSASPVVKNFASINHTGLNYSSKSGNSINDASTHDAILSSATIYPLWIAASKPVTASTTSGTGWSYDAANNKLSLNNATINGSIISGLGDLTIDIQGTNTISVSDTASVIRSTSAGKLTITKTGTTTSLQLNNTRQSSYHSPIIKDFASFELAEGLYLSNAKAYGNEEVPAGYEAFTNVSQNGGNSTMGLITPTLLTNGDKGIRIITISTEVNYPIWVATDRVSVGGGLNQAYVQITANNKDDVLTGTANATKVSFIPASTGNGNVNTLVLNGAAITDAIISNLANLTIEFSGTNSLCENGKTAGYIHSSNPNAIITFKSVADNSSISLECANDYAVVEGFANVAFDKAVAQYSGSFSYNTTEKRYKNNSGALQSLTIKAPTVTDISSCFQGQNNYGTYYNTADNYTIPAGMEAYIVTGVSGNQVVLKSLSILPKQTALLLFKGTATSFNSVTTNETADTSENILMHADATVTTTGKEYILYKDEFVKATGTIPSGKCYLYLTGVAPARGMYGIGNDGSTAIEGIDVEATEDETWYDLQGRRIQKPTKAGIYIVNGKKMIINNK